jgi:hypothetical protein
MEFKDPRRREGREAMIWVAVGDWERVPPKSGEDERDLSNVEDVGID